MAKLYQISQINSVKTSFCLAGSGVPLVFFKKCLRASKDLRICGKMMIKVTKFVVISVHFVIWNDQLFERIKVRLLLKSLCICFIYVLAEFVSFLNLCNVFVILV